MRTVLVWGLLAGLLGGLLALGFASVFGEPPVEVAISLEEQEHGAQPEEAPPVGRGVQRTVGLAIATCAFGVAVGGLFALAFAFAYGRIGRLGPRGTALVTAAIAFVAVALVPFLTYPPNPPGVGREETIGDRTALYFAMVAISVLLAVAAIYGSRRLGGWLGAVASAVGYVVAVAVAAALLPHFDEVPAGFPAQVLWEFRLASLGTQAVLWATIGVGFAVLLDREVRRFTERGTGAGLAAG
ncbi:MAG TPA: CbtA family protein [Actinophytocola sp.]|uniref:CbtA family protein n=1 Tax=Actinophytocola sp. TaxID=1872138 RepID=UPI002DDD4323|nr:CbtA family protein [Actinophytocola sp.]HEV2783975.1 CbtA family protein [Actinophytocola sp.]